MLKKIVLAGFASGVVLLSGCAAVASATGTTDADIVVRTAKYLGKDQKSIKLISVDRSYSGTAYQVEMDKKLYNCYMLLTGTIGSCKQAGS